jgi:hypothetical protein
MRLRERLGANVDALRFLTVCRLAGEKSRSDTGSRRRENRSPVDFGLRRRLVIVRHG